MAVGPEGRSEAASPMWCLWSLWGHRQYLDRVIEAFGKTLYSLGLRVSVFPCYVLAIPLLDPPRGERWCGKSTMNVQIT
jgi:hypothetical protein